MVHRLRRSGRHRPDLLLGLTKKVFVGKGNFAVVLSIAQLWGQHGQGIAEVAAQPRQKSGGRGGI